MKNGGREHYTIREMRCEDIPTILFLAEQALGKNYIQESTLVEEHHLVVCAEVHEVTAGFCTGKILPVTSLSSSLRKGGRCPIPELERLTEIGWVGSLAVSQQWRRRGIGTMLVQACLERLHSGGAAFIMMGAWKSPHGAQAGSIAEAKGFHMRCEIPEFWKEESLDKQYSCTVCIPPPCRCAAVIYTRP